MKKLLTSFAVAVLFVAYMLYQRSQAASSTNADALNAINNTDLTSQNINTSDPSNTNSTANVNAPSTSTTPRGTTSTPTTKTTPVTQTTGRYKNGTYTGTVADAYYGNIQVRATISSGKLTQIDFLQFPNDRGHSIEINDYALPILRSEAIANQSSQVDIVSGATDSSQAFIESLHSALLQAS